MITKRIVVGGGGGADGIFVYFADGESKFYKRSDVLEDYDSEDNTNWQWTFYVTDGKIDQGSDPNGEDLDQLYDDTGEDQASASIPIIRNGSDVSTMGTYTEEITCVDGESVVAFYKIG